MMEISYCPLWRDHAECAYLHLWRFKNSIQAGMETKRLSGCFQVNPIFKSQLSYALLFVSLTRWVKVREVFILFCGLCDTFKKKHPAQIKDKRMSEKLPAEKEESARVNISSAILC